MPRNMREPKILGGITRINMSPIRRTPSTVRGEGGLGGTGTARAQTAPMSIAKDTPKTKRPEHPCLLSQFSYLTMWALRDEDKAFAPVVKEFAQGGRSPCRQHRNTGLRQQNPCELAARTAKKEMLADDSMTISIGQM